MLQMTRPLAAAALTSAVLPPDHPVSNTDTIITLTRKGITSMVHDATASPSHPAALDQRIVDTIITITITIISTDSKACPSIHARLSAAAA